MPDFTSLALFLAASLVVLVVPGPAVLYIVARSIDQGRLAGVVSTLGVGLGTLVHVAAAALGLSALLATSALAFTIVKYVGAAYLVYLGIRKLLDKAPLGGEPVRNHRRLGQIFWQGVVVNVLNPKTALFFFAFLPQFVDVSRGAVGWQIAFLGVLFVVLGIVSDGIWALAAGTFGDWLRGSARVLRVQRHLTGGVFIGLGVVAALAEPAEQR